MPLDRRSFLHGSLGAALLGACGERDLEALDPPPGDSFAGGERLGVLDWVEPDPPVFGRKVGRGWDGRRFRDLRRLDESSPRTPTPEFFLRTFAPPGHSRTDTLHIDGAVEAPVEVPLASLRPRAMGDVMIECAGNDASASFGLMSSGSWEGVPLVELLDAGPPLASAVALRVGGVDAHDTPSQGGHSQPGAAWIFQREELETSGAFLATGMNGHALPGDHGAPLRLVVPNWYGCAWIKWVDRLSWVGRDAPATSQMREFAGRTHQRGVPELARDYAPARIDAAALPVRVERWRVGGLPRLRIVGVRWGEAAGSGDLAVQIGRGASWERVRLANDSHDSSNWQIWEHAWPMPRPGRFAIRCRFTGRAVRQRRLRADFYERAIRVPSDSV